MHSTFQQSNKTEKYKHKFGWKYSYFLREQIFGLILVLSDTSWNVSRNRTDTTQFEILKRKSDTAKFKLIEFIAAGI